MVLATLFLNAGIGSHLFDHFYRYFSQHDRDQEAQVREMWLFEVSKTKIPESWRIAHRDFLNVPSRLLPAPSSMRRVRQYANNVSKCRLTSKSSGTSLNAASVITRVKVLNNSYVL